MLRRFCYTGRKRIPRERIHLVLHPHGGDCATFDCKVDLHGMDLPGEAGIVVEAYDRTGQQYGRFSLGTIANGAAPTGFRLDGFENPESVTFRVKVIGSPGRRGIPLLASADRLVPRSADPETEAKDGLLPVRLMDLGQELWTLDVEGERPVLYLNNKVPDVKQTLGRSSLFKALVYPEVLRKILNAIFDASERKPHESEELWHQDWLQFASALEPLPPADVSGEVAPDEWSDWCEEAAKQLAQKHRLMDKAMPELEVPAES